jgi:hypothetical protein
MTGHRPPARGLSRRSSRLVGREPRRPAVAGIIRSAAFLARHVGWDGGRWVWTHLVHTKGLRLEDGPIHAAADPGLLNRRPLIPPPNGCHDVFVQPREVRFEIRQRRRGSEETGQRLMTVQQMWRMLLHHEDGVE